MGHFLKTITDLYSDRGDLEYQGEGVSQLAHGWQCAMLAKHSGADVYLQTAAFLHDIGHLFSLDETPTLNAINDDHENLGAAFLERGFTEAVVEPVRLHVSAKRYLVTRNPQYLKTLSKDSLRSLALQGGPMSSDEARVFLALPYAAESIQLRIWDDQAKDASLGPVDPSEMLNDLSTIMESVQC